MGLRHNDLRGVVYDILSIDEFSSKMGEDENVATLSFSVKEKDAALDLSNFVERGYETILDSDVSPGEDMDGRYQVFIEIPRDDALHEVILQIVNDVKNLTDVDEFKFRYYKRFRSVPVTMDNLKQFVPNDPEQYGIKTQKSEEMSYFEFFDKSSFSNLRIINETITIETNNNTTLRFKIVDFGKPQEIQHTLNEQFDIMESYPEILYLTKCLGDYNISKYGDNIVLENAPNLLVLQRLT